MNYISIKLLPKNHTHSRSDKVRKTEKTEQGRWVGMRRWEVLLQESR